MVADRYVVNTLGRSISLLYGWNIYSAVSNTIHGLNTNNDDCIIYEPINVAYGASSTNYVWFQFVVYFFGDGSVQWSIWDFPDGYNGVSNTIPSSAYIPGHTYNFALTPASNYVDFSIYDATSGTWSYSWNMNVPGTSIIDWPDPGCYSPASCVEGYTSNNLITNVPYFQTYLGYGETTYYQSITSGVPFGISTGVWSAGSGYYYWSMLSENYASSIIESQTGGIGYGSVNNEDNLVGTRGDNYATIYGGNFGDGGRIVGQMNAPSGGNIYLYGCSVSGYYSNLYVYVSSDDSNWIQIGSMITVTSTTTYWISIGQYFGDFQYIEVVGYDSYDSVNLHLYTVAVAEPASMVKLQVYDDSSGSYIANIPSLLDGSWVFSGNTYAVLSGNTNGFQACDSDSGGAFQYFYDSAINYFYWNNPTDIAIPSDTTVTIYYNHIPTYTLTVYATDQYGYGAADVWVDYNWVGYTPLTMQITLGSHSIGTDPSQGYMQWLDLQVFDTTGFHYYYTDGQIIPIVSDTTITAQYLYW